MGSAIEEIVLKSDEDGEHEETIVAKAVAMAVLFFASLVFGLLPMVLAKKFKLIKDDDSASDIKNSNRVVVALLSFGGGALLCTTFQHLLPEVGENISILQGEFFLCPKREKSIGTISSAVGLSLKCCFIKCFVIESILISFFF